MSQPEGLEYTPNRDFDGNDGLDDKPTHRVHKKEIKFRDKYGNEKIRYEEVHVPTDETREKSIKIRLQSLYEVNPTTDPIYTELARTVNQVIVCPQAVAKRIIATNLREVPGHFKWVDGPHILTKYLESGDGDTINVGEGFPTIPRLYIFWGYYEAKNRYLPMLVRQMMGARERVNKHCWIFCPQDITTMTTRWGASMAELHHVPWVHVPMLDGIEVPLGSDSTEEKLVYRQTQRQSGESNWGSFQSSETETEGGSDENPGDLMDMKTGFLNRKKQKDKERKNREKS